LEIYLRFRNHLNANEKENMLGNPSAVVTVASNPLARHERKEFLFEEGPPFMLIRD